MRGYSAPRASTTTRAPHRRDRRAMSDSPARRASKQEYGRCSHVLPWTTTHCGPCRTRTCGVGWLPVPELQSGAFAAQPTTQETRERPALGDECRTSLPRVSSDGRTRTYNPAINNRLRYLLRHVGIMKHYTVLAASARRESNPHHPLRRRMLCPLSYRRLMAVNPPTRTCYHVIRSHATAHFRAATLPCAFERLHWITQHQ